MGEAGPVAQARDKRAPQSDRESRHHPLPAHTETHPRLEGSWSLCKAFTVSVPHLWVSCSLLLSHFLFAFART